MLDQSSAKGQIPEILFKGIFYTRLAYWPAVHKVQKYNKQSLIRVLWISSQGAHNTPVYMWHCQPVQYFATNISHYNRLR